ncbi:ArsB/NhaD family transporter [Poriferisphaera corsica]|nr:SLC13 family permease [Poriferisphaera corsica]
MSQTSYAIHFKPTTTGRGVLQSAPCIGHRTFNPRLRPFLALTTSIILPHTMTTAVIIIFILVYLGMIAGRIPFLRVDRTGIALLGAVAMLLTRELTVTGAWQAVDASTIFLLFALMVISANFAQSGLYALITRNIIVTNITPKFLLLIVIFVIAFLSALLANDIVCLATTPVLLSACMQRKLNPIPYLIALACAANIGSAATLIGNPQNILIGEVLRLSFPKYLAMAILPVTLSLIVTWGIIVLLTPDFKAKNSFKISKKIEKDDAANQALDWPRAILTSLILIVIVGFFLFTTFHKPIVALAGASLLLLSRKQHTASILSRVDWQLLLLFIGLFIVNDALYQTQTLPEIVKTLANYQIDLESQAPLYVITAILSNLVSNVPAVLLLLNVVTEPSYGPLLALSSTLAGNFIIVGSIANIIVVTQAERGGIKIDWLTHARIGIPVTITTLALTGLWLALLNSF